MDSESEDRPASGGAARQVQQQLNRQRARSARRSVLVAIKELRRSFDELRALFPAAAADLQAEEAAAEVVVLAAAPDVKAAMARVKSEEAAARQRRMMTLGVAGLGVAVVVGGVVYDQRRRHRERVTRRDGMRAPLAAGAIAPLDPPTPREVHRGDLKEPRVPPPRSLG